ncbi:hypothetical protein D4764_03G0003430, partial [Takifugu flavidus]
SRFTERSRMRSNRRSRPAAPDRPTAVCLEQRLEMGLIFPSSEDPDRLPWAYLDRVPCLRNPQPSCSSQSHFRKPFRTERRERLERRGGKTKAAPRQVNEARRQLCGELHQYSTEDHQTRPTMSPSPGSAAEGCRNRREQGIPGKFIRKTIQGNQPTGGTSGSSVRLEITGSRDAARVPNISAKE